MCENNKVVLNQFLSTLPLSSWGSSQGLLPTPVITVSRLAVHQKHETRGRMEQEHPTLKLLVAIELSRLMATR